MDFPETDPEGAPRILPGQVIGGDVCRYLEFRDDGTVHTSRDLTAHRKDAGDWWDRHLNPITDQASGRVATYLVRPRRQDPPTAPLVFALDVAGTRYTGGGPDGLHRLVTRRVPLHRAAEAFQGGADDIKVVLDLQDSA
jgi:hypothetical protein